MENIYVHFGGMVYQQKVGIPMGTNCAPLISDLILYCYERDFMSNLQKSKRFDLIDKFNDTSRYLDEIFTIDNPDFAEHIPDIYRRELQLNKANTSDKETSFSDLNIKVVGSNIHTSVYDKCDDFGFPIVNFPWLNGDVPRLPSYGIYISQLVKPQSDIHCNRSATSPRPKFKTVAEVAEESQLGFADGRRLVGD